MENFYHIYALGFCNAEKNNDLARGTSHHLHQVSAILDRLKALGTSKLILGPVFQSETHGYDTIDYYKVDRRLGDEQDLRSLVESCHQQGIEVVLDCVFNHVSRSHFAFMDLKERGQHSPYCSWFKGINFGGSSPYGDSFDYETWDGHYHLVKWNLSNEEVKKYLLEVALYWIDIFDIDGLRMDAANVMDLDFLKTLSTTCKARKPGFFMLGEIVGGDYRHLAHGGALDGVTNYECYKGLYSSLNDANYFEIAYALDRQFGPKGCMKDIGLYNFVDNHDVNRVASELKKEAHLYPLYVLLYTMPGLPSIYYLSEYGKTGKRTGFCDDTLRTPYFERDCSEHHPLFVHICQMAHIRKELKALSLGDYTQITVASEQLAFLRTYEGEKVLILLNASDQYETLKLPRQYDGRYLDLLNHKEIYIQGQVQIDPNWGKVLKLIE